MTKGEAAGAPPHYLGHRERLRDRFRKGGADALAEYELEFRVLFLDKKNHLIADEVQGIGTVDYAPVYPREIMRRALELSASAIMVHNHA